MEAFHRLMTSSFCSLPHRLEGGGTSVCAMPHVPSSFPHVSSRLSLRCRHGVCNARCFFAKASSFRSGRDVQRPGQARCDQGCISPIVSELSTAIGGLCLRGVVSVFDGGLGNTSTNVQQPRMLGVVTPRESFTPDGRHVYFRGSAGHSSTGTAETEVHSRCHRKFEDIALDGDSRCQNKIWLRCFVQ